MIDTGRSKSASERNPSKMTKTGKRLVQSEFVTTTNEAFEPVAGAEPAMGSQRDEASHDAFSESSAGVFSPTLEEIFSPPTTDAVSSRHVAANRLSSLESQLALMRTTIGDFPSYSTQLHAIEKELSGLKELESVPGQLKEVGCRLEEVERLLNAEHAARTAMSDKVETMGLALEVVEQSLEYFEETDETLDNLRSRMDDFDIGMEKSELRADNLARKIEDIQRSVDEARTMAQSASAEVKDLKQGVSLMSSGASTPVGGSISERSSSARVKAAVHTLSDGYRSLHKAMNLMYDEQTDLACRVARVGAEVQQMPTGGQSRSSKIRADKNAAGIASFPLTDVSDMNDDACGAALAQGDAAILVQANAVDLIRNDKRVEALEAEVRFLRNALSKLLGGPQVDEEKEAPRIEVKLTTVEEDGHIRVLLVL